jgi:hypothetical protein
MNRINRRIQAAKARQAPAVSSRLLQKRVMELEAERFQMQNVLMAICKDQGRVRISMATIETLREGDRIDAIQSGDHLVITFVGSDMVVPGGVEGGKPRESA